MPQAPNPKSGSPEARARRRRPRWLLASALVLAAAVLVIRVALPLLLRTVAQSQASTALGGEVRIANVDLWLLSGGLAVEGVRAGSPDEPGPSFGIDRAYLRLRWGELVRGTVRLDELILGGLTLHAWRRPSGDIEIVAATPGDAVTDSDAAVADTPVNNAGAAGWPILIDRIELNDVDVEFHDQRFDEPREGTFRLEQLAMREVEWRGRRLGFGSIEIEDPALRFPPALAMSAAGAEEAEPEPAPEAAVPGEPFDFGISELDVRRAGVFVLGEQSVDVTLHLHASEVTARANTLFPVELEVFVGGEEDKRTLAVDGQLGLVPLAFDGRVEWSQLLLANLITPFSEQLAPWVDAGRTSGGLDVTLRLPAPDGDAAIPDGLRASGEVRIDDLTLSHGGEQGDDTSLAWRSLETEVRELAVPLGEGAGPVEVALTRIALRDPVLRVTLGGEKAGDDELVEPAADASAHPESETGVADASEVERDTSGGVRVRIDALEISGGDVTLLDRSVEPFYRGEVSQLRLSGRDARWPGSSIGELSLEARLDDAATLVLRGKLTSGARSGEARFEVEHLPLRPFNPYSTRYTAYRIEGGTASLHSDLRIDGSRYATQNALALHDFEIAEQSEGEFEKNFGVPLQLGLALLRDIGGEIALAIPFELGEEGATVGLGKVIRGALRRAVTGALTAPLKAVGMLIPKDKAIDVLATSVPSVPGRAETTPGGGEQVAALVKVLASRPALAVALRGSVGEPDRPMLARRELLDRAEAGDDWPEIEGGSWLVRRRVRDALAAEFRGEPTQLDPEDVQALERWIAAVDIPASRVEDLAARRSAFVRDALIAEHGVAPSRVGLAQDFAAGDPGVIAELKLVGTGSP